MKGFKGISEYKKSKEVRKAYEKDIDKENKSIDFDNGAKIIHNMSVQTCVTGTQLIMLQYARYLKENLPLDLLDRLELPKFGIVADLRSISKLAVTEDFSNHKTRNSILRLVFGKAEHYDAKADYDNNQIAIENKEYEISLEYNEKKNIDERLQVITKLRHMLEENQSELEYLGHYNLTDTYLFTVYSGIKIFELLSNILEGIKNG